MNAVMEIALFVGGAAVISGIAFGVTMFIMWWWHQTFI